jgi:hypothetical protein
MSYNKLIHNDKKPDSFYVIVKTGVFKRVGHRVLVGEVEFLAIVDRQNGGSI